MQAQVTLSTTPPPARFSAAAWAKASYLYGHGLDPLPTNRAMAEYWGQDEDTIAAHLKPYEREMLVYRLAGERFANLEGLAAKVGLRRPEVGTTVPTADPKSSESPRAHASWSSSSPTGSPTEPTEAELEFMAKLANGMRHQHLVSLPRSTWAVVIEYIRRIEATGKRGGDVMHEAGAKAAENSAKSWSYVRRTLDNLGYGPHGAELSSDGSDASEDNETPTVTDIAIDADDDVADLVEYRDRKRWSS